MARAPVTRSLDHFQTGMNVHWRTGKSIFAITVAQYTQYTTPQGAPRPPVLEVSLTGSNVPGLGGTDMKKGMEKPIPPGMPPPAERNKLFHWSFPHVEIITEVSGTAFHEIVERGLYHVYTAYGIIEFAHDSLIGDFVPYIINHTLAPGTGAGHPPGDVDSVQGDALANMAAVQVFGSGPPPTSGSPWLVETLASRFESTSSTSKEEEHYNQIFVNIDRFKKSLPRDDNGNLPITHAYFTFAISSSLLEGTASWEICMAQMDPITGIKGYRAPDRDAGESFYIPYDETGADIPYTYLCEGELSPGNHSVTFRVDLETYELTVEKT